MSYSHESNEHRDWVLALATRLRGNGVDVCLDRWDVTLGETLALSWNARRVMRTASSPFSSETLHPEG